VAAAFYRSDIGVGHALLLAKLPADVQEQGMTACFKEVYTNNGDKPAKILLPVRNLRFWIETNVLLLLKDAPFDTDAIAAKAVKKPPVKAAPVTLKRQPSQTEITRALFFVRPSSRPGVAPVRAAGAPMPAHPTGWYRWQLCRRLCGMIASSEKNAPVVRGPVGGCLCR
jgi:hypothetical protein